MTRFPPSQPVPYLERRRTVPAQETPQVQHLDVNSCEYVCFQACVDLEVLWVPQARAFAKSADANLSVMHRCQEVVNSRPLTVPTRPSPKPGCIQVLGFSALRSMSESTHLISMDLPGSHFLKQFRKEVCPLLKNGIRTIASNRAHRAHLYSPQSDLELPEDFVARKGIPPGQPIDGR